MTFQEPPRMILDFEHMLGPSSYFLTRPWSLFWVDGGSRGVDNVRACKKAEPLQQSGCRVRIQGCVSELPT